MSAIKSDWKPGRNGGWLKPFKPGQPSACPSGGRSRLSDEFYTLARQRSPEALAKCIELMSCGDHRVELMASIHVMDRGMGKCRELPPEEPRQLLTPDERLAMLHEIARRLGLQLVPAIDAQVIDSAASPSPHNSDYDKSPPAHRATAAETAQRANEESWASGARELPTIAVAPPEPRTEPSKHDMDAARADQRPSARRTSW